MSALRSIFERELERERAIKPTPRPEGVRIAGPDDRRALFDFLMLLAEENAIDPVSDPKVLAMIDRVIERRDAVAGIFDAQDGSIAASVGIMMAQWWYSEAWRNEEMWAFVHPDHRRGHANYAQKLIQFSKWWAEQTGFPILLGVLSSKRTIAKIRLYARNLPVVGAIYLWRGGVGV